MYSKKGVLRKPCLHSTLFYKMGPIPVSIDLHSSIFLMLFNVNFNFQNILVRVGVNYFCILFIFSSLSFSLYVCVFSLFYFFPVSSLEFCLV